jgi:hypothetical protein
MKVKHRNTGTAAPVLSAHDALDACRHQIGDLAALAAVPSCAADTGAAFR